MLLLTYSDERGVIFMLIEERPSSWEARKGLSLLDTEVVTKENILSDLGFVRLPKGKVRLGTDSPLPCRFEGYRFNETPVRELDVDSIWINRFAVTNKEFEEFNPKRFRPPTSVGDRQPVTNVTYLNALRYAEWLSTKHGLAFTLPTEAEWVYAAAPFGWQYPYHENKVPDSQKAHNFILGETEYQTVEVDDPRFGVNCWDLYHMGGNVQELTLGSHCAQGSWGATMDGRYCIVKGGGFGHCPLSSGVQRRGIMDVSARSERVGFRLAHSVIIIKNEN